MFNLLFFYLPLAVGGVGHCAERDPAADRTGEQDLRRSAPRRSISTPWSSPSCSSSERLLVGLLVVATVPRLLNHAIKPDKIYRLYGVHYAVHRAIVGTTNNRFFKTLFGDSSSIVHYLRYLGYRLPQVEQTGSNFGTQLKHDNPYLSTVGSGTMVADGLSIINATFSSTSFRVSRVSIGAHNFLGNLIAYPAQGKTGDNCLIGTKTMVPIDGEIREGVGLLGSPCFEIPRSVQRDTRFDHLRTGDELRRRLAAKNRHNAVTAAMYLFARWIYVYGIVLLTWTLTRFYGGLGTWAIALASVVTLVFTVLYFVVVERAVQVFLPLRPLYCSIYDRRFWRHERFWKAAAVTALPPVLQRHAVQEPDLADAGRPARPPGLRRRLLDPGEVAGDDRRRRHPQRRLDDPVPLAGGRRLQVRPHHHRCRLHRGSRRLGPLRRDDRRRRSDRPRLLPDEGRGRPTARDGGPETRPEAFAMTV